MGFDPDECDNQETGETGRKARTMSGGCTREPNGATWRGKRGWTRVSAVEGRIRLP
jgi:hypothetical protein